ncbi:MAG: hypothetical protein LQ337_002596 [Flavoplaca oasis]|nr:MAG: hypothetical protein LQ337_002596 [Flavoplaca oasis]
MLTSFSIYRDSPPRWNAAYRPSAQTEGPPFAENQTLSPATAHDALQNPPSDVTEHEFPPTPQPYNEGRKPSTQTLGVEEADGKPPRSFPIPRSARPVTDLDGLLDSTIAKSLPSDPDSGHPEEQAPPPHAIQPWEDRFSSGKPPRLSKATLRPRQQGPIPDPRPSSPLVSATVGSCHDRKGSVPAPQAVKKKQKHSSAPRESPPRRHWGRLAPRATGVSNTSSKESGSHNLCRTRAGKVRLARKLHREQAFAEGGTTDSLAGLAVTGWSKQPSRDEWTVCVPYGQDVEKGSS